MEGSTCTSISNDVGCWGLAYLTPNPKQLGVEGQHTFDEERAHEYAIWGLRGDVLGVSILAQNIADLEVVNKFSQIVLLGVGKGGVQ
jgi:hypothetical protein